MDFRPLRPCVCVATERRATCLPPRSRRTYCGIPKTYAGLSSNMTEANFRVLTGVSSLAESLRYKVWLLDQFGVLHDGHRPYPRAVDALNRISQTGVKLVIISNSSRRAASTYERMETLGFEPSLFAGVITSGELTHQYLLRKPDEWFAKLGRRCVHITWDERSSISLEGLGLEIVESPEIADFVLVHGTEARGLRDGSVISTTLDDIQSILAVAARRGLPMIVANPDYVTVEARDLKMMPGTLGLQYEKLGGYVKYMGKPDSVIYEAVKDITGSEFRDMVAVGDSLAHDIKGASENLIDSVFVAGGIHATELKICNIGEEPKQEDLRALFGKNGIFPTFVVPNFKW